MTLVAFLISSAVALFIFPNRPPWPYRIDFDVYRMGGQVFLDGGDLYGILPTLEHGSYLPFTYPPLAAALFSTFTLVPLWLGQFVFTAGSIACLVVVCRVVLRHLPAFDALRSVDLWWLAVAATTVALWLEPVRDTLNFGQINIVLMTLVVLDALVGRHRWWRGLLVGLAISIKLTPAVFLLLFFVRRDWRALTVAAASAVGYAGLGYLLAADDSITYWTSTLFETGRIGTPHFANNQSLRGELGRLGVDSTVVWLAISVVAGLLIAWAAWRLTRAGADTAALTVVSFAALFCSPVSWDHSWVWVVPTMLVLLSVARCRLWDPSAILVGVGLVVFSVAPHQLLPNRYDAELSWSWWEHVLGSSYLLWGLAVVVTLGVIAPAMMRPRRQPSELVRFA